MRLGLNFVKEKCEVVIFIDADNEIFASDLNQVMDKYKEPNVLSVFGSRFMEVSFSTIKKWCRTISCKQINYPNS